VRPALDDGIQPCREREDALARAGGSTEADDADGFVEQEVECDALLGAATGHVEDGAVGVDETRSLAGRDAAQRALRTRDECESRVARHVARGVEVDLALGEELVDDRAGDDDFLVAGPVVVGGEV
jgi:hypothetical protein